MDDWGDIDSQNDTSRMARRNAGGGSAGGGYDAGGRRREERFAITLAVAAALTLVLGLGVGFALGRATAPKPAQAPVVAEVTATVEPTVTPVAEATASLEPTVSSEPTPAPEPAPTTPPKTPRQLDPDDGKRIDASKTTIRWSKVTAEDGSAVTYAFEIQTRVNGTYTDSQVIDKLKNTSYSVRVLQSRRRWRVWAVDANGNASKKSDWSYYQHTAPKPTTPSKTTTGT